MSRRSPASLALLAVLAAAPATARPYAVDPAASKLGFEGVFDGRPFSGAFKRWKAEIDFDPAKLQASRAAVTIDMSSVSTGVAEYDQTIASKDWFAVGQFPTARFVAIGFRKTGPSRYEAQGKLTIRNVTRPVALPFTLEQQGPRVRMHGEVPLDRTQFGLGGRQWASDKPLAKTVKVKIDLLATPR